MPNASTCQRGGSLFRSILAGSRFRLRTLFVALAFGGVLLAWWRDHNSLRAQLEDARIDDSAILALDELQRFTPPSAYIGHDLVSFVLHVSADGARAVLSDVPYKPYYVVSAETKWTSREVTIAKMRQALSDPTDSSWARGGAAMGLKMLDAKECVADLVEALRTGDSLSKRHAAVAVAHFASTDQAARDALLAEMNDPHSAIAAWIAHLLRESYPEKDVVPRLVDLLDHTDPVERQLAASHLGDIHNDQCASAVPKLAHMLLDADERVRTQAAAAVAQIAPPETSVPLLRAAFSREEDNPTRANLARLLLWTRLGRPGFTR